MTIFTLVLECEQSASLFLSQGWSLSPWALLEHTNSSSDSHWGPAPCCFITKLCLTLCNPTRLLCPWDFPDKSTGVGCHFLLQWSSLLRDWTQVSCISCISRQTLPLSYQGSLKPFSQILEKSLASQGPGTAPRRGLPAEAPATPYTSPPPHFLLLPLSRRWLIQLSSQPNKLPSVSDCSFL